MKSALFAFFAAFLLLCSACQNNRSYERKATKTARPDLTDKQFLLRFFQDGEEINLSNGTLKLEAEDFVVEVNMNGVDGIYANLCMDYNGDFAGGGEFEDLENMIVKGMAGTAGNEDNELIVNCESYNNWYIRDEEGQTSFNDLQKDGQLSIGRLSVNNFYFSEVEEVMDVTEMRDDVYLYVAAIRPTIEGAVDSLLQSEYIKIVWL